MRKKILLNYILILIISSLLTGYMAYSTIKGNYLENKEDKYVSNIRLIESSILENYTQNYKLNYFKLAQNYAKLTDSRVTFYNYRGVPIADSINNSIIFDDFSDSLGIKKSINNTPDLYTEFSQEMGKEYYYYSYLLNLPGGDKIILRLGDSVDRTDALIDNFLLYLMISILASLIIGAILSYITVENLVLPLNKLTESAKLIAGGNFNHKLNIDSDDEIGELTASFNTMTRELKTYIDSINKAERMRKDFVANISHELRTPLTSILGFVETLRLDDLDEETKLKALDIIEMESNRLRDMINQLLILSKVESIEEEKAISLNNLNGLILNVTNLLKPQIERKNINLTMKFSQEEALFRGDENLLRLVLINLIENAIKYNKYKGKLHIETTVNLDKILLSVEDTGIGIGKENIEKIFERFYRINSSRNFTKGSGLGLAISNKIVLGLGGSIEVDSNLGEGTKFTVIFTKAKASKVT